MKHKTGESGEMAESNKPPSATSSAHAPGKPSALVDTRVIWCGDNLEQLKHAERGVRRNAVKIRHKYRNGKGKRHAVKVF